jgi:drug/metabolite transporter (DMT)-like permease
VMISAPRKQGSPPPGDSDQKKPGGWSLDLRSLALPLLSGLGLGVYFIFMHQGSRHGIYWPMVASRLAGTLVLLTFVLSTRQFQLPRRDILPLVLVNSIFDVAGNIFYILAGQAGRMDVAVVLGSLYSGVTVLLAWVFLKEKLDSLQVSGIVTALAAIVLMTL